MASRLDFTSFEISVRSDLARWVRESRALRSARRCWSSVEGEVGDGGVEEEEEEGMEEEEEGGGGGSGGG